MKILVTGGAGFIGSHLSEALINQGHQVIALDTQNLANAKNLERIVNHSQFTYRQASILDEHAIQKIMKSADGVMHFAAAVGVKKILDDPINSLITNLQGSLNVMNAAAINNLPTILASTSEIYGKNPNMPLREDSDRVLGSPLLSRWTYSEAKALDESIARHLFENSDWKVKIVRLFNVVGPRQSKEFGMVIPRFINAATNQLPLQVYGDGRQKRVFCHVEDAVTGIIQLWNFNGGYGEPFNIGGYEEISILDLASRIIKITNSSSTIEFLPYKSLENGFEDIFQRIPDISKMFEKTGWFPKHNVEKILSDTFLGQEYF